MKLFLSIFLLVASLNAFAATPVINCTASGTIGNNPVIQKSIEMPVFGTASLNTLEFYGHTAAISHQPVGQDVGNLNLSITTAETSLYDSAFEINKPVVFRQNGVHFMLFCVAQMKF